MCFSDDNINLTSFLPSSAYPSITFILVRTGNLSYHKNNVLFVLSIDKYFKYNPISMFHHSMLHVVNFILLTFVLWIRHSIIYYAYFVHIIYIYCSNSVIKSHQICNNFISIFINFTNVLIFHYLIPYC